MADIARKSVTAQTLMQDLESDWSLEAADLDGRPFAIDTDSRIILLDTQGLSPAALWRSDYLRHGLTLSFFGALRAAWHGEREAELRAKYRPDLWLMLGRIISADIAAMTARMAFEVGLKDCEPVWRHALGDESGDMALAYLNELDRKPFIDNDTAALAAAFERWFGVPARVTAADMDMLGDMDLRLETLKMRGSGTITEGAVKCLTLDPLTCKSYLGPLAAEIAGNPVWRTLVDPVVEAHFLQLVDEIGMIRIEGLAMRDKNLAARLFPDALIKA